MIDLFSDEKKAAAPFTDAEKVAWLRLIRSENIGPITFYKLLSRYGSATKALENLGDLSRRGGRAKPLQPADVHVALQELEGLQKINAQMICACEDAYPLALSAIHDAPPCISVIGHIEMLHRPVIGMVGARNASLNGRKFAADLAQDLGQGGQIIASGLARGIDTAAHNGALETGTIAVVAGGVDVIYPPENQKLYQQICECGAVVAESVLSQEPFAQSFPRRNRIISGLSTGVIVVEASLRSGSLITARMAAEQGRDVFAVPGFPRDPRAQGPNKLIQDGAILTQNADDVRNATDLFQPRAPHGFRETPPAPYLNDIDFEEDEGNILSATAKITAQLGHAPVQIDHLLRETGLPTAALQSALLELELAGRLHRTAGGKVSLIR